MLILSRKPGERLVVPQLDLSVTVLGVSGKTVRLGIEAPSEVVIVRAELGRPNAVLGRRGDDEQPVGN